MFAGCASTGARFTLFTVTVKDLLSDAAPSLTLIETEAVPASENPGAIAALPLAVPVPALVVVTVTYARPEAFVKLSAWPSASVAESGLLAVAPSLTVTFAGCASTGARFPPFSPTRRSSDLDAAPSLTLIETEAVPASENPGAIAALPLAVPVPAVVVV